MALAGERACYNTVIVFGTQLLLLGTKSLHVICMRTWTERLQHLIMQVSLKRRKEFNYENKNILLHFRNVSPKR